MSDMDWVGEEETKQKEELKKGYFNIVEGDNKIQLLTHCAKLVQVFENGKFRPAREGDEKTSIKALCYVLQDGLIKEAKLPYTVVKQIQALRADPDWTFDKFPMPRMINIRAVDNGKKFNGRTVLEYTVMPSPKDAPVSQEVMAALKEKPTPEERVEKMKEKAAPAPSYSSSEDEEGGEVPF